MTPERIPIEGVTPRTLAQIGELRQGLSTLSKRGLSGMPLSVGPHSGTVMFEPLAELLGSDWVPDRLRAWSRKIPDAGPDLLTRRLVGHCIGKQVQRAIEERRQRGSADLTGWERALTSEAKHDKNLLTAAVQLQGIVARTLAGSTNEPLAPKETVRSPTVTDYLDRALEWLPDPGTRLVIDQLNQPLIANTTGLAVSPDPESAGSQFVRELYQALSSLKEEGAEGQLTKWLLLEDGRPLGRRLTIVKAMVMLTFALDSSTLKLISADEAQDDVIDLQPFRCLIRGIEKAADHLSHQHQSRRQLTAIIGMANMRFREVRHRYRAAIKGPAKEALRPSPDDATDLIVDWVPDTLAAISHLPQEIAEECCAFLIVKYLHHTGLEDSLLQIVNTLAEYLPEHPNLPQLCRQIADCMGLSTLSAEEEGRYHAQTVRALAANPWPEIADPPQTDNHGPLTLYIFTGTFGPAHNGHIEDTILRTFFYQLITGQPSWLFLVAPLPRTSGLPGYGKTYAKTGALPERVLSLAIPLESLCHALPCLGTILRRKIVLAYSPNFQPNPQQSGSITNSLETMMIKARALFPDRLRYCLVTGGDEIGDLGQKDWSLPEKFTIPGLEVVICGRQGFLQTLITYGHQIHQADKPTTLLLGPGINPDGSAKSVAKLAQGGKPTGFYPAVRPLIAKHWSLQSCREREGQTDPGGIPPIAVICRKAVAPLPLARN